VTFFGDLRDPLSPKQRVRVFIFCVVGLLIGFIARESVGHPLTMSTRAMVPGIWPGDVVWVTEKEASLGDVVQVRLSDDLGLYRLVATGGQTVEMRKGRLLIDGKKVDDGTAITIEAPGKGCSSKAVPAVRTTIGGHEFRVIPGGEMDTMTVPRGDVFLLGDHRGAAGDSRPWGTLPKDQVEGVARRIIWSWDSCSDRLRWHRMADSID
jgi:signal peptidase I